MLCRSVLKFKNIVSIVDHFGTVRTVPFPTGRRRHTGSFLSSAVFSTTTGFHHTTWSKMPAKPAQQNRVITISVDGNISSGKSTLVSKLKELIPSNFSFQVELVPEPLEKWTNLQGHNLLEMFYDDPVKNNFMFQHYVQLTRLMETIKKPPPVSQEQQQSSEGTVRIMERSLQNNRYCFTELARREGRLEEEEFAVLSEWHNWLESKFDLNLDVIIYLRTSPETVYNRMQMRGRKEESSVPLEYLKSLHETYEDWLIKGKLGSSTKYLNLNQDKLTSEKFQASLEDSAACKQKIIVIDANQGKEQVATECSEFLTAFMNEIGVNKGKGELNPKETNESTNSVSVI